MKAQKIMLYGKSRNRICGGAAGPGSKAPDPGCTAPNPGCTQNPGCASPVIQVDVNKIKHFFNRFL